MRSLQMVEMSLGPLQEGLVLLLVLSLAATGCDGGGTSDDDNESPLVENEIQDQDATSDGEAIEIDLTSVFSVPSGATLSYSASSSNTAVAEVDVSEALLRVTPREGGEANITVTATNDAGEATDRFAVAVFADPPDRP